MSIKLITGATSEIACFNALKQVSPDKETYIVVPDRATLQIEEMLFDALNISSTFNINIVGIGNLASKFVTSSKPLSEVESILFVRKAIENKKNELKYFQSTNINFCKEVYKIISQFSSSSIEPQDIRPTNDNYANKKIQDLKIIFEEFKALTSEYDDPSEILDKFACVIQEERLFEGDDFFFVGFDSFTSKHYRFIEALCSVAENIFISCAMPISRLNSYVYDGDIFEKIKKLAKKMQVNVEVISLPCELKGGAKTICEHLFANDDYVENCADVRIFEGKTKNEEAEFIAKTIAYEVYHGARYRDFAIAASSLASYEKPLRFAFEKNNIPCYFDTSCVAGQTYLALMFKKILLFSSKNFNKDDLMFILSSPLLDVDSEILSNIAERYAPSGKNFFALSKIDELKNLVKAIMQNFILGAKNLIEFLQVKSEKLTSLDLDEKTLNMENQIPDILANILSSFEQAYPNGNFQDFVSAIELGLESSEVSALPSYYDEVYVGDANDSYFTNCKRLFIVGANAGVWPKVTADDAILTDSDLALPAFTKSVEPTIKMINRRYRAKIFELLCSFKEELFVTYSLVGEDSKPIARSMILEQLIDIFNKKDRMLSDLEPNSVADKNMLLFCMGKSEESAKELASSASNPQVRGLIENVLHLDRQKFLRFKNLQKAEKLKLGEVIRPTEIEKFYDCPFKLYCENILKLKQKNTAMLSPIDRGSIIHDLLEEYGKKYQFKDIPNLDKFVENKVEKSFDFSTLPDGDFVKQQLIYDAKKICELVKKENADSAYEPWKFEKDVSSSIGGASVYGRIDRIDKAGDVFRIIDYKTGKVATNLVKEMSYGKKLQLFVYAKIVSEQTGLKCGGIYYFKTKSGYNLDENSLFGITTQDGKSFTLDKKYFSNEEFISLENSAEKLIEKASQYLKEGKLYPSPDNKSCEFCQYKSICLYDSQNGTRLHGGGEE